MGHLRKTARLNFKFFRDCGMIPIHIRGDKNFADAMTKILSRLKLLMLIGQFFGVNVEQNEHGSARIKKDAMMLVRHEVNCTFGDCADAILAKPANMIMMLRCACEVGRIFYSSVEDAD